MPDYFKKPRYGGREAIGLLPLIAGNERQTCKIMKICFQSVCYTYEKHFGYQMPRKYRK